MKRGGGTKSKGQRQKQKKQQLIPPKFPNKGSVIEVSSDEEGFKGVWFPATVIQFPSFSSFSQSSQSRNKARVFVEYTTLLSDDRSPTRFLREYVTVDHIRPPPPPSDHPFQLGDVVDAFYKDGWWTGVITAIIPHLLSFVVSFPNPPDDRVFDKSLLRPHLQWVNGKWVHPANQSAAELMFSAGKKAEVSFDRLCNCWHPATILEDTGNGCYLVEYESLKASRTDKVKATVDSTHIRPCPPRLTEENLFSLRQNVDALFDNAWWCGTIIQELSNRYYVVHIKSSNKERRLHFTDLRPHLDWSEGIWYKDETQDVPKPSDDEKRKASVGTSVKNSDTTNPRSNSTNKDNNSTQKTVFGLNLNEADPSNTNVESPRGTTLISEMTRGSVSTDAPSSAANPTGTLADKIKIRGYTSPTAGNTSSNQSTGGGDLSGGHVFGKRSKRKRKENHDDDTPVSGKTSGSLNIPVKISKNAVGGKESNGLGFPDKDPEEDGSARQTLPVIIGLECDKRKLSNSIGEGLVHVEVQDGSVDIVSSKFKDNGETSNPEKLKRGRGRPRKLDTKISIASPPSGLAKGARVDKLLEKVISFDTDSLKDVEVKSAELDFTLPSKKFVMNGSGNKLTVDQEKLENRFNTVTLSQLRKPSETDDESLKHHMRSSKRCKKRTMNINLVSQVQDSPHPNSGKMVESKKPVLKLCEEKPMKAFEDQPLSQWFQEMLPATTATSKATPAINADAPIINADAPIINADAPMINADAPIIDADAPATNADAPATNADAPTTNADAPTMNADATINGEGDVCEDVGSDGGQDWPFVKKSILWSTVENMEALRKLPQKPHFRPLEQSEESCREGRAIGCMVNFCTVVDRTSKLRVDEPKSSISGLLETLLELEEHGFKVQVVRDRITGLLTMRQKQEKLQEQVEELNAEIEKQNGESVVIDEEMDGLKQQMNALQEKLTEAQSRKDAKKLEIDSLLSKMEEIRQGIEGVEREFQSSASSLM